MAHLNYFPTIVAGVNVCFFIAAPSGGGCWYYAKCEMLLHKQMTKLICKIVDIPQNFELRRWRHARWLTATTVATDSCHPFSKRWQVTDVINVTGDDQATLIIVDQNSADIAYIFWFYVCLHLRDRDCCSVAGGNGSCHELTLSFFEQMTHCWH